MKNKIDKKLYQQAHKIYQQWNEAGFAERIKNAGKLSPADAFKQYVSLVEFCWKLWPKQRANFIVRAGKAGSFDS
ncbi:hypothetical protein H8E88_09145 [candidate division KSB1 bacterium]|nr:hypothetical protein [candidate division KSB1 bacterium]